VKGYELHARIGSGGGGIHEPHVRRHRLERLPTALRRPQVLLVHLVREQHELVARGKVQHDAHVRLVERVARGVAGVDDHQRAHTLALGARSGQRPFQLCGVQPPAALLCEEIPDSGASVQRD
jgi:hypothetical protein